MTEPISIKRGDTLLFYVNLKDAEGEPLDFPVNKMFSQMRTATDKLVDTFKITATETTGKYKFEGQADSNTYPLEKLYIDIQFEEDGVITTSDTFEILIKWDVSRHDLL